jgi:hypothetical protein
MANIVNVFSFLGLRTTSSLVSFHAKTFFLSIKISLPAAKEL